jgi:uncharacterized membrane protein
MPIVKRLLRFFLTGLLTILPLAITLGVIFYVLAFVRELLGPDTFVGGLLAMVGLQLGSEGMAAYVIGWAVVIGVILSIGILADMGAKRYLRDMLDGGIRKLPVIGGLYGSLRQVMDLFDDKEETDMKAMSVVFCYFGSEEGPATLALMPTSEKFTVEEKEYNVVIIPTAPVPFGGALLFVPVENVKEIGMTADGLMSIYVSMGVTTDEFLGAAAKAKMADIHIHPKMDDPDRPVDDPATKEGDITSG